MPSVSKKQHNFMAAVANNPAFAKKAGVAQSVGKDFLDADKGLKFGKGTGTRADLQKVNRPKTDQGKSELFAKGGAMATKSMKALFAGKETKKEETAERKAFPGKMAYKKAEAKYEGETMKKGGTAKYANGGITKAKMGAVKSGGNKGHGEHSVQSKGHTKGKTISMAGSKPLGMKRGGKC